MTAVERPGVHRQFLAALVPLAGELTSYSRRHLRGDLVAGLAAAVSIHLRPERGEELDVGRAQ